MLNINEIAAMIDHTELNAHAQGKKIANLCLEAKMFGFVAVCVNPVNVELAVQELSGSKVTICSVVGFPLGASKSISKAHEAEIAVNEGAGEIDMVINVGALKDKRYDFVKADIAAVVKASKPALVKVILETCYLMDEEIIKACELTMAAGAQFVKTSTGFGAFGAFPQHVKLMRETVGPDFGVKASGGIKNFKDAWRLINAGANRLGTSAGVSILEGARLNQFVPDSWLEPEIPCHICPSRHAQLGKLPKALYTYYKSRCLQCSENEKYNKFYE